MFSLESELILRNYNKTSYVSLETIRRILVSNLDDISGELLYNSLPVVLFRGKMFNRGLEVFLNLIRSDIETYKNIEVKNDISVGDFIVDNNTTKFLADLSRYRFGTINNKADTTVPIFIEKCEEILSQCDSFKRTMSFPYFVQKFRYRILLSYSKYVSKNLSIEEGINCILATIEPQERDSYIFWISKLVSYNKLYEASRQGMSYSDYFTKDIVKNIDRIIS
jgi:hypothetical protein